MRVQRLTRRALLASLPLAAVARSAAARGDRQGKPPTPPAQDPKPPQDPKKPAQGAAAAPAVPPVPPPPPASWTFAPGSGMLLFQVNTGSVASFETVAKRIKAALAASKDPIRKRQAKAWHVYKSTEPPGDTVMYIFFLGGTALDADYDPIKILSDEFPAEAQTLYDSMLASAPTITRMGLQEVIDMAPGK